MQDLLKIDKFLQEDGPAPHAQPGTKVRYTISEQERPVRQGLRTLDEYTVDTRSRDV